MNYFNRFCVVGIARSFVLQSLGDGATDSPIYIVFFVLSIAAIIAAAYFLGGINFAIIISKKKFGTDIRDFGSGNAGMTNMMRTFGKKAGIITFAGDIGKTVIACLLGYLLLGRLGAFVAGLFCMVGHMFPAMYKFKGGKGVACAIATILMTDIGNPFMYHIPLVLIITLTVFAVVYLVSKYISLSAIMSILIYPMVLYIFENVSISTISEAEMAIKEPTVAFYLIDFAYYVIVALLMATLVIFMHRANIGRLYRGEESKTYLGKKKSVPLYEQQQEQTTAKSENAQTVKKKNGKNKRK